VHVWPGCHCRLWPIALHNSTTLSLASPSRITVFPAGTHKPLIWEIRILKIYKHAAERNALLCPTAKSMSASCGKLPTRICILANAISTQPVVLQQHLRRVRIIRLSSLLSERIMRCLVFPARSALHASFAAATWAFPW
jgi:hypothetical protein